MGYCTRWEGTIDVHPKDWEIVKAFLELVRTLWKGCFYISSFGPKGHRYQFHIEDEWIGYLAGFDLDEKNHRIIIETDGKHYNDTVPTLCYCILQICPEATGNLEWDGEEDDDQGYIELKNGKIIVNDNSVWQLHETDFEFLKEKDAQYNTPKYDFARILKFRKNDSSPEEFIRWLKDQVLVNTI